MQKIGEYNILYGIIDSYSCVISPISIGVAGGVTFGIPGAVIGVGLNLLDELSVYSGFTKDKYLTVGFVGLTVGYTVYPSVITGIMGILGTTIVSHGLLEELEKYDNEVIYSLIVTVAGACRGGMTGALFGASLAVIDQILHNSNVTNIHYLPYIILGVASTGAIFKKSMLVNSAGVILGVIFASYEKNVNKPFELLEISKELYSIYSKIIPKKLIDHHIIDHVISLLGLLTITHQLKIKMLKCEQGMIYQFEHMDENIDNTIHKLNTAAVKFLLFSVPYLVSELVSSTVNSFYSTILFIEIDNVLRKRLFTDETALKLSFNINSTVLIDNQKLDSKMISYEGAKLFADVVSRSIKGVYGAVILMGNSPDILIYSILYNQITGYVSRVLSSEQNKYEIQIKKQESVISSILKHDMQNIKIITERGGIKHSYKKIQFENDILRTSDLNRDQIVYVSESWKNLVTSLDFVYNYYLIGYKINQGIISFDDRTNLHYCCWQVSNLLSWSGKKAQEISSLRQSITRIEHYLHITNDLGEQRNIKAEINRHNNSLILSEIEIIIGEASLLRVDRLEFGVGKRYAISGPSGSGKSSLMSKVIGIRDNNVDGEGTIHYPAKANIHLISQQDYFLINSNLQEIIFYPEEVSFKMIDQVRSLIKEVGLEQYRMEQIEDWFTVLSGGQKKKIMIISAIIKDPDILILDEAFNGIDKNSLIMMQDMIIKHLPNTLVISIDHNAQENNNAKFYDEFLIIIDGVLSHSKQESTIQEICFNGEGYNSVMFGEYLCF